MKKAKDKDQFELIPSKWQKYEDMLDSIEEQLIRSEGIYYYSKVSSIEESIDENTRGKIERMRSKMHQEVQMFTIEIDSLSDYPKLSDFIFVEKFNMNIKTLTYELHHLIGTHIAFGITNNIYTSIKNEFEYSQDGSSENLSDDGSDERDFDPDESNISRGSREVSIRGAMLKNPQRSTNQSTTSSLFDKSFKFISLLSESEENFDKRLNTSTVPSINKEYDELKQIVEEVVGKDDAIKLDEHRDQVSLIEILQTYKDIIRYQGNRSGKSSRKLKKYYHERKLNRFNDTEINPLLKSLYNPPVEGALNENTVLNIWCNQSRDRKFIQEVSHLNFPKIKTLSLTYMDKIKSKKDVLSFNQFLAHSITKNIDYLHLSADKKSWGNTSHIKIKNLLLGIKPALNLAQEQAYIGGYSLGGPELKQIFENSHNCKHLILYDCAIESLLGFSLDPNQEHKMKTLDLFRTAAEGKKNRINIDNLEIIVSEMSNTTLKNSLSNVYVEQSSFHPDEVQHIFDKYFMKVVVTGGDTWPLTHNSEPPQSSNILHSNQSGLEEDL